MPNKLKEVVNKKQVPTLQSCKSLSNFFKFDNVLQKLKQAFLRFFCYFTEFCIITSCKDVSYKYILM